MLKVFILAPNKDKMIAYTARCSRLLGGGSQTIEEQNLKMTNKLIIAIYLICICTTNQCLSQTESLYEKEIGKMVINNYIGYGIFSEKRLNVPDELGKNVYSILKNEKYDLKIHLIVSSVSHYDFNQYVFYEYYNLGFYSYCAKPCSFDTTNFENFYISTGKLFIDETINDRGIVAYDTISNKAYFLSGFGLRLDLDFYDKIEDETQKIELISYMFNQKQPIRKGKYYYYEEEPFKLYLKKGIPILKRIL